MSLNKDESGIPIETKNQVKIWFGIQTEVKYIPNRSMSTSQSQHIETGRSEKYNPRARIPVAGLTYTTQRQSKRLLPLAFHYGTKNSTFCSYFWYCIVA